MSQAKVDKYKEYKKNRREILAKEKRKKKMEKNCRMGDFGGACGSPWHSGRRDDL